MGAAFVYFLWAPNWCERVSQAADEGVAEAIPVRSARSGQLSGDGGDTACVATSLYAATSGGNLMECRANLYKSTRRKGLKKSKQVRSAQSLLADCFNRLIDDMRKRR